HACCDLPVTPLSLPAMGLPALRKPDESGFFPGVLPLLQVPGAVFFAGQPASGDGKVNRPRERWPH
ncbi:hypothetical protein LEC32_21345, partial [Salmonella enterica]|nr:hypothetical protein [Salmonella enterica]